MIAPARERFFSYVLVRAADEMRGEHLNIGVLVYDPISGELFPKFDPNLERVERTLPGVRLAHLRSLVNSTSASMPRHVGSDGVELLSNAHERWSNALRASPLRSILGRDLYETAEDLFERYVLVQVKESATDLSIGSPLGGSRFSDGIAVRSLRVRLQHAQLRRGRDFTENAQITGFTKNQIAVPVWFPLQVRHTIFMDGVAVHGDPARDYDLARLAAQKVEQTLRAMPSAKVTVAVRDPEDSRLGVDVTEIILGEGNVNGVGPAVLRYSDARDLDSWVAELVRQPVLM
ncbi:MAG: DUF3037 domain-containing protein [Longimicrobiaceae bacterium]